MPKRTQTKRMERALFDSSYTEVKMPNVTRYRVFKCPGYKPGDDYVFMSKGGGLRAGPKVGLSFAHPRLKAFLLRQVPA